MKPFSGPAHCCKVQQDWQSQIRLRLSSTFLNSAEAQALAAGLQWDPMVSTTLNILPSTSYPTTENPTISDLLEIDPGLPVSNPTEAFWQSPPHRLANIQSTLLPSTADVVIIGSGITGCSAAKALLETSNHKVVLLEARSISSGATGRNGGHLTSSAVEDYPMLVQQFGKPMAKKIARFTFRNVERVYEVSRSFGDSIQLASEARQVQGLGTFLDDSINDQTDALALFEEENPDWKGRYRIIYAKDTSSEFEKLPNSTGALVGPAGAIWPYRLVTNVFDQLLKTHSDRFVIETSIPVLAITYNDLSTTNHAYTLSTPRGSITAGRIIHCTNGHAGHLLPGLRNGALFPLRGTMSVQKRGDSFPNLGASRSWSFHYHPRLNTSTGAVALGLYYMTQNAHTGDIFVGGENGSLPQLLTSDDSQLGPISSVTLKGILPELFGDSYGWAETEDERVKSLWSGIMGFTADGVPLVGRVPESVSSRLHSNGEWIAAGFNGYGMVNAWLCGEVVVDMMMSAHGEVTKAVAEWFPEAYLVTEERLRGLTGGAAIERLFGSL